MQVVHRLTLSSPRITELQFPSFQSLLKSHYWHLCLFRSHPSFPSSPSSHVIRVCRCEVSCRGGRLAPCEERLEYENATGGSPAITSSSSTAVIPPPFPSAQPLSLVAGTQTPDVSCCVYLHTHVHTGICHWLPCPDPPHFPQERMEGREDEVSRNLPISALSLEVDKLRGTLNGYSPKPPPLF